MEDLMQLTGSEKQIAWAKKIRQSGIKRFTDDIALREGSISRLEKREQNDVNIKRLKRVTDIRNDAKNNLEKLLKETSASRIIDNRYFYTDIFI